VGYPQLHCSCELRSNNFVTKRYIHGFGYIYAILVGLHTEMDTHLYNTVEAIYSVLPSHIVIKKCLHGNYQFRMKPTVVKLYIQNYQFRIPMKSMVCIHSFN